MCRQGLSLRCQADGTGVRVGDGLPLCCCAQINIWGSAAMSPSIIYDSVIWENMETLLARLWYTNACLCVSVHDDTSTRRRMIACTPYPIHGMGLSSICMAVVVVGGTSPASPVVTWCGFISRCRGCYLHKRLLWETWLKFAIVLNVRKHVLLLSVRLYLVVCDLWCGILSCHLWVMNKKGLILLLLTLNKRTVLQIVRNSGAEVVFPLNEGFVVQIPRRPSL